MHDDLVAKKLGAAEVVEATVGGHVGGVLAHVQPGPEHEPQVVDGAHPRHQLVL